MPYSAQSVKVSKGFDWSGRKRWITLHSRGRPLRLGLNSRAKPFKFVFILSKIVLGMSTRNGLSRRDPRLCRSVAQIR